MDKARNLAVLDESKGISVETWNYRSYKEAFSRLQEKQGAYIRYYAPGELLDLRLYVYEKGDQPLLKFSLSSDGIHFEAIDVDSQSFASPETNYDYLTPRLYQVGSEHRNSPYIKVEFTDTADIVRAEIDYR
ncbi:hypothetical protein [Echinimonas agarilytica]|uniref:Uncharacterized protein n=1 Tax=Echinimonas agarilytica TaxID=1215918 RepID=A0AA41W4P6_9GAMM|nr:hypothetical protein [Echinimonas agarilytica]MCM2678693.1 hypothetical protein [Echinimonas agarilytica]